MYFYYTKHFIFIFIGFELKLIFINPNLMHFKRRHEPTTCVDPELISRRPHQVVWVHVCGFASFTIPAVHLSHFKGFCFFFASSSLVE